MAKFLRYLIIGAGLVTLRCAAQEDQPAEKVSIEFTVYAFNDEPAQVRYAVGKGASPELHFFPTARSAHYRYQGSPHLVFFRQTQIPSTDGQPPIIQRHPIAEVHLDPAIRKPLFVFSPVKGAAVGGMEFSISVFDDSLTNLPAGHLSIFNATDYQVALRVGRKSFTLNRGPSSALPTGSATKVVGSLVIGGVAYPGAIEGIFPGGPDERGILFLYPPLRRGSPVLQYAHLVEQVIKPVEPKAR